MENDEEDSILCPMIASWIAIPASYGFLASLYFILGIPILLLYILSIIFTIFFFFNAINLTISFKTNNKRLYMISYYISYIFLGISCIFFFAFIISGFIYIISHFRDINIPKTFAKMLGIFFPFGIQTSMLINIVLFAKKTEDNPPENISEGKDNKVEIQTSTSIDEKKIDSSN